MEHSLRTLKDADLDGKRVLLRLDLNVPLDEHGIISDDTRIVKCLPTIKYLVDHHAKVIILSHLGRPKGEVVEKLRLKPVSSRLSQLIGLDVKQSSECIGSKVTELVNSLNPGEVCMLENTRFYPEEENNDYKFANKLAKLGDIFVSDAFGTVHRAHASTVGIAHFLPSYAGFLLDKELKMLSPLLTNPASPLSIVVGGAKIDTKIGLIKKFLDIADNILVGGGLANTFLAAEGYDVGDSLFEKDKVDLAGDLLIESKTKKASILLPTDVVVADRISEDAKTNNTLVNNVPHGMKILDIGNDTIENYATVLRSSRTVVWNGPLGLYEVSPFANGTREIANIIAKSGATSILGGGDTVDAINQFHIDESRFTHVSTGGGAMLEFLQGDVLPGVDVLLK